ncbi:MAG: Mrp/NBP35 family ATP-binding protein, partial [Bifidobacterium sp.]|nr:Mrp/NBP35 family ATP-binding protein [Bifidobacterium sp.]
NGERLRIFGQGGGQRVADQLTRDLGYQVPLLEQLPLQTDLRESGESGRPAVLRPDGSLDDSPLTRRFVDLAKTLMAGSEPGDAHRAADED